MVDVPRTRGRASLSSLLFPLNIVHILSCACLCPFKVLSSPFLGEAGPGTRTLALPLSYRANQSAMPETIAEPLFGSGFLSLSDISALSTTCKALLPLRGHLERVVLRDYNVTAASPSVEAEAFTRLLLAQKALRVLELRYRPLGWVLPFLAHPRSTRALESLNLSWNILQPLPVCLDTIFTPGAFPSLRELTLGGPWSAEGAVKGEGEERISTSSSAWLSPSVFPRLVSLTLVDVNGLDTPYLLQCAFGSTAKWPRLEKLVLEGRLGGTCFMATLAEAIG